jgi:hypothetical protein
MTTTIFPAVHRRQYPGLARVFDENAAQSDSAFTTHLQSGTDRRVLTTLVEELFRVLEYTVVPVESWHDTFDTVLRKGTSEYPVHTILEGKPSRTTLQQLTAAYTDANVPHSILVSAVTTPSERTKRVAKHSGVRVIDQSELRELVQGAISRLTELVHASGTKTRHTSPNSAKIDRLVTKLENACDEINALLERDEFAAAANRRETVDDAISRIRTLLPVESENQQFRERLTAVETRVSTFGSKLQAAYTDSVEAGDSHVETAKTAVEDGDITTGLHACKNAQSAYADARMIADNSDIKIREETGETAQNRIDAVRQIEQQLQVKGRIQQAESRIESLAVTIADANTTAHTSQLQSELDAAVRAGFEQLDALPDEITDPVLQARVAALEDQVEQFETTARRSHSSADTGSPEEVTASDSTTPTEIIHKAAEIIDCARQPAPVVLRLHEELTKDRRRTVFHAETLAGDSVQFDVWHRHSDQETWQLNQWYLLENVRGQHWTVANGTGVTLATTPTFTATRHELTTHSGT